MVYTQAPPLTSQEIESLLNEAKIARFCSLNPDGTIHATPVNYKYEDERIIIATPAVSRKARNVKRNRNVTILIDTVGEHISDFKGVVIYGKADVKELMLREFVSINETWLPSDRAEAFARTMLGLTKWVMIRVEPERTASYDYAKDEVFRVAVRA